MTFHKLAAAHRANSRFGFFGSRNFAAACKLVVRPRKAGRDVRRRIMKPEEKFMKTITVGRQGIPTGSPKTREDIGALSPQSNLAFLRSIAECPEARPPQSRFFFLRFPFQLAAVAQTLLVAARLLLLASTKPIIDSGRGGTWRAWRAQPPGWMESYRANSASRAKLTVAKH